MRRVLAALAALAAAVAYVFSRKAKDAKTEAKQQEKRAERAEAGRDQHRRTDEALANVEQKHRGEQKDGEKRLANGRRDHLDGVW